jgi:hypothetical protein
LKLEEFLNALGSDKPVPGGGAAAAATGQDGKATSTVATAATASTPGETTGTLLYKVFGYFDRLGPHQGQGKYFVRCPWAENHNGGRGQDHLDSSTVIFTTGSTTGGFKCQHEGGGIPGQCSMASAADVLRWARRKGVPAAVLPDRSGFGAIGASDAEAAAETIEETTASLGGEAEKASAAAPTATPSPASIPTTTTQPPAPPQPRRKKTLPS